MSVMLDWKITMKLEGKWSKQSIEDLNTAMNGWWGFCDYVSFFSRIKFSARKRSVSTTGYSNKIHFDKLVNYAANGAAKDVLGWDGGLLEERKGFDPAVHQRLLDSMKADKSEIKFTVDEEYEGELDEWYTINYKVTSDGERFAVDKDFGEGDFLVTGKLCGDWSEEAVKLLNELMDYLDEDENAREHYMVRGVHFTEAEMETAPVSMGGVEKWLGGEFGYVMADAIGDSGASDDLPVYQTLLDAMKAKDLRVLFHVSGNGHTINIIEGQDYIEYMMSSDGEAVILAEQGGNGQIFRSAY